MKLQSLWFIALSIAAMIPVLIIFFRKKNPKLITFYFAIIGIAYMLEYVVKVLFDSYDYYPDLLKYRYYDDLFGANASQAFAVPAAALWIAVFRLGFGWILFFTGLFAGIEEFFLYIHIYEHHWWRTGYTVVGVMIYFLICKKWLSLLQTDGHFALRFFTVSSATLSLLGSLFFYSFLLFGTHEYHMGWFENKGRDSLAFTLPVFFLLSILFAALSANKAGWAVKIAVCFGILGFDWILWKGGILQIYKPWAILIFPTAYIASLWMTTWFHQTLAASGGK